MPCSMRFSHCAQAGATLSRALAACQPHHGKQPRTRLQVCKHCHGWQGRSYCAVVDESCSTILLLEGKSLRGLAAWNLPVPCTYFHAACNSSASRNVPGELMCLRPPKCAIVFISQGTCKGGGAPRPSPCPGTPPRTGHPPEHGAAPCAPGSAAAAAPMQHDAVRNFVSWCHSISGPVLP